VHTPGLEDDIRVVADILFLLDTRTAIGYAEGVVGRQEFHIGRGRAASEGIPAAGVVFGRTR
jgi:hypothetical protein